MELELELEMVMVDANCIAHVLSEDAGIRERLQAALGGLVEEMRVWDSPLGFLESCDSLRPGILILDHFMLQMSGLELYEKIRERRCVFATILILTEPRIDVAVNAVQMGTVDVLCLPLERECFQQALKQARNRLEEMQRELLLLPPILPEGRSYLSLLTRRETQVVELVCDGATNREISAELGICKKTVERHRSNAMKKMRVNSVARLTRLVDRERQQRHFRRPRVMERFRSVSGYR